MEKVVSGKTLALLYITIYCLLISFMISKYISYFLNNNTLHKMEIGSIFTPEKVLECFHVLLFNI